MAVTNEDAKFDLAIMQACKNTKEVKLHTNYMITRGEKANINISSMITLLVQEAGRYAENYASDIIISVNELTKALENPMACNGDTRLFGIRKDGVDHYEFVRSQMKNYVHNFAYFGEYYRKIYAITTSVTTGEPGSDHRDFYIEMKEISTALSQELYHLGNERKK